MIIAKPTLFSVLCLEISKLIFRILPYLLVSFCFLGCLTARISSNSTFICAKRCKWLKVCHFWGFWMQCWLCSFSVGLILLYAYFGLDLPQVSIILLLLHLLRKLIISIRATCIRNRLAWSWLVQKLVSWLFNFVETNYICCSLEIIILDYVVSIQHLFNYSCLNFISATWVLLVNFWGTNFTLTCQFARLDLTETFWQIITRRRLEGLHHSFCLNLFHTWFFCSLLDGQINISSPFSQILSLSLCQQKVKSFVEVAARLDNLTYVGLFFKQLTTLQKSILALVLLATCL